MSNSTIARTHPDGRREFPRAVTQTPLWDEIQGAVNGVICERCDTGYYADDALQWPKGPYVCVQCRTHDDEQSGGPESIITVEPTFCPLCDKPRVSFPAALEAEHQHDSGACGCADPDCTPDVCTCEVAETLTTIAELESLAEFLKDFRGLFTLPSIVTAEAVWHDLNHRGWHLGTLGDVDEETADRDPDADQSRRLANVAWLRSEATAQVQS